jgi:hypothetical protein
MLEFGISVGFGRSEGETQSRVLITLANSGSATFSPDAARMVATQLWMAADFLDPQEGKDGAPIDGN